MNNELLILKDIFKILIKSYKIKKIQIIIDNSQRTIHFYNNSKRRDKYSSLKNNKCYKRIMILLNKLKELKNQI